MIMMRKLKNDIYDFGKQYSGTGSKTERTGTY